MKQALSSSVIIIGAGPCGLMLAIELGRRGIGAVVLEEKISPQRFPAANATQARTMEHYRRLGFANGHRVCRPITLPILLISRDLRLTNWPALDCRRRDRRQI
jgi:2-polyprenyl-6-methoxyphenol hydroxylase-like FAD-dependent oxidoreductase